MKYILGVIGAVILAIIAIIIIGGRNPDSDTQQKANAKKAVAAVDFSSNPNSEVSWMVQGKLVGEDQRKSIRVTVTQSERKFEILNGYEETVESVQRFNNSPAAYDTFLRALDVAGFGKDRKVAVTDERGICPQGNRYIYDIENGSEHPLHTWSTTCTASQGTFAGSPAVVRQLFQDQIPDYSKLVQGIKLQ